MVVDQYMMDIVTRSFFYAFVVLSAEVLWGRLGLLSFGQSAFFAIGAYSAGIISTRFGLSFATAIAGLTIGLALSTSLAFAVGSLSMRYGQLPLYSSVVTLVLAVIVTQVLYSGGELTGSSSGLSGYPVIDISSDMWFW